MKKTILTLALMAAIPSYAQTLVLPPFDVDLVGSVTTVSSKAGESLLDIAREHDFGQDEIVFANPDVDRWLPTPGSVVTLPGRFILPDSPRKGVVLNLPELRIYHFSAKPSSEGAPQPLITHPVSVGRMDWNTPLGTTKIVQKKKNPTWTPPESIKREHELDGDPLPDVVPAGPDNPLGLYAMRLGIPGYLIHSTNKPFGVGMRVTHGCVRMYPEDIEIFFNQVEVNTEVTLVNQPVKLGWYSGQLYLEIHPPLDEDGMDDEKLMQHALDLVEAELGDSRDVAVRWSLLRKVVKEKSGMPAVITQKRGV